MTTIFDAGFATFKDRSVSPKTILSRIMPWRPKPRPTRATTAPVPTPIPTIVSHVRDGFVLNIRVESIMTSGIRIKIMSGHLQVRLLGFYMHLVRQVSRDVALRGWHPVHAVPPRPYETGAPIF